jgi:hypothetical protein
MAKIVTVDIDLENGNFSVDLTGFQGKGCEDVQRVFDAVGKRTKDIKKPEFKLKNSCTVKK